MDGWRIGAPGSTTTYDLEALTSHLTMNGSAHSIDPGDEVTYGDPSVTAPAGGWCAAR